MEKLQIEMSVIEIQKPKVFRLLYDTFYPRAYLFAGKLIQNNDVGADIAQETFLYIWQKTKIFPSVQAFKSYMYSVLKNKCLNYIRDKIDMTDITGLQEVIADDIAVEHILVEQELNARILLEINRLPEMKREIMLMRLEGKSFDEISEELKISINTVKAHKKESYKQLRIGLADCEKLAFLCFVVLEFLFR